MKNVFLLSGLVGSVVLCGCRKEDGDASGVVTPPNVDGVMPSLDGGPSVSADVAPPAPGDDDLPAPTAMPGWPALRPFRGEGITFARPAAMVRKDAPPGTYRFERETPSDDDANSFQFTYLGRVPWNKLPESEYLIRHTVAERHLTVIGTIGMAFHVEAEATADTGVPGPNRYVRLLSMSRWDVPAWSAIEATWLTRGAVPNTMAAIAVEVGAPTLEALENRKWGYILESIGWSAAVIDEFVPAEVLVGGAWRAGSPDATTANYSATGDRLGGNFPARGGAEFNFEPGNRYRLVTANAVTSRTFVTPTTYYVDGTTVLTYSSGEYRYTGGVLTLSPSVCATHVMTATDAHPSRSECHIDRLPTTLRLEQDENGVIRLNGMGGEPVAGWQSTRYIGRPGNPGPWNVPHSSAVRVPGEPPGPINWKYNACGIMDNEPNDVKPEPYALGQTVQGCIPAKDDTDYYELFPPAGDNLQGWGEVSFSDVGPGTFDVVVNEVSPEGVVSLLNLMKVSTEMPGQSAYVYWKRVPGQRYAVSVRGWRGEDPFTYKMNGVFKTFEDTDEPVGQPTPKVRLELGVPRQAYFYSNFGNSFDASDQDIYLINLKAGPARVLVEDIPSDVKLDWDIGDTGGFGVQTPVLDKTVTFSVAGERVIKLWAWLKYNRGSAIGVPGQVAESMRKPYRITVTQP
jgi:hypothetical protein